MFLKTRYLTNKPLPLLSALLVALGAYAAPGFAAPASGSTTIPIQHLVIMFQENVSFDHYFGTYPPGP